MEEYIIGELGFYHRIYLVADDSAIIEFRSF